MRNLKELKPLIIEHLQNCLKEGSTDKIEGLRIDRRKPHTDRLFFMLGDERICLHIFQPADEIECFAHPHSWNSEVTLLKGKYMHSICTEIQLDKKPEIQNYFTHILTPGASYSIDKPTIWHKVVPLEECYTMMINAPLWDKYSNFCTFTKGKELVELDDVYKLKIINIFLKLLYNLK